MSTPRPDEPLIRRYTELKAANELLQARVAELEAAMGMTLKIPLVFNLSAKEASLFGVLMTRSAVSKESAMTVLYGSRLDSDRIPNIKVVDVFICHIRRKIRPFKLRIETIWGQGYCLPPDSKQRANQLIQEIMG